MQISVFNYLDYKKFLEDWLTKRTPKIKGGRSRMAEAMGSKHSYLSRVLNEEAHISLEQAEQLNAFLGHTDQEAHLFLLLVSYGRADTAPLRDYYKAQIEKISSEVRAKQEKHYPGQILSREQQNMYYSEWYFPAVHMSLLTGREPAEISSQLGLTLKTVNSAIEFLISIGLVEFEKGKYRLVEKRFGTEENSAFLAFHHTNWRLRAIYSLEKDVGRSGSHKTFICAISEKDLGKVKAVMNEAVAKVKEIAEKSCEDTIACVNFDVFKL